MRRLSERFAVVLVGLTLAPAGQAQTGVPDAFSGPWLDPWTGAVVVLSPCTPTADIVRGAICVTVVGWQTDTPLSPDATAEACNATVALGGFLEPERQTIILRGLGILAKLGDFSIVPGEIGALRILDETPAPDNAMERRIVIPDSVTWFAADGDWTPCKAAPTS